MNNILSSQIVINEYSAANLNGPIDDFKKTEDWIEIYNVGNDTINIGEFYLSDNKSNLQKWKFPNNTKIASHSFLTVWASGRDTFSNKGIHTNFRLT
jgi:hypothetical protein